MKNKEDIKMYLVGITFFLVITTSFCIILNSMHKQGDIESNVRLRVSAFTDITVKQGYIDSQSFNKLKDALKNIKYDIHVEVSNENKANKSEYDNNYLTKNVVLDKNDKLTVIAEREGYASAVCEEKVK